MNKKVSLNTIKNDIDEISQFNDWEVTFVDKLHLIVFEMKSHYYDEKTFFKELSRLNYAKKHFNKITIRMDVCVEKCFNFINLDFKEIEFFFYENVKNFPIVEGYQFTNCKNISISEKTCTILKYIKI